MLAKNVQKALKKEWVYPNAKDVHLKWMMSDPEDWLPHSCLPVAFTPSKGIKDDSDKILMSLEDDESEYSLGASSMEEDDDDEDDETSAATLETPQIFSI